MHGRDPARFARHGDGREERPGADADRCGGGARGGLGAAQKMLGSATGAPNEVSRKSKSQPSSAWRMCFENIQP